MLANYMSKILSENVSIMSSFWTLIETLAALDLMTNLHSLKQQVTGSTPHDRHPAWIIAITWVDLCLIDLLDLVFID